MELQIEYVDKKELKKYENNAKIHIKEQVEQIKKSIEDFGFNDPIAVWKDNEVIEGHGRLLAAMQMKEVKKIPIIRLDNLSEEQRKAYAIVHNKLTMNSDFDAEILSKELESITEFDMSDFGFLDETMEEIQEDDTFKKYVTKNQIPHYEITGDMPELDDLVDTAKRDELVEEIQNATVSDDIKDFLVKAAQRHLLFNYRNIAEFYAHQDKEVQELMEKSGLVIIDINNAIANGFVKLNNIADELLGED